MKSSLIDNIPGINMIVAMGEDGAIGKNGDLIWKISDDLKRFKALTTGHPVIMGRKTWESLPKKPLPNRKNIVLTRKKDYQAEGAVVVTSPEEAIRLTESENPFIIGGAEIYNLFMPVVSTFHITKVFDKCPDADSFLTLPDSLQLVDSSPVRSDTTPSYQFLTFLRTPSSLP